MDHTPVPFGDDVGLDVLAALRELGDGLSKLSDIESISKTGQRELLRIYVVYSIPKYHIC